MELLFLLNGVVRNHRRVDIAGVPPPQSVGGREVAQSPSVQEVVAVQV